MDRKDESTKKSYRFAVFGAGILALAVIAGILVMVLTSPRNAKPESTPEPTTEPTVTVTAAPTPTPTPPITAIRLYAYGRELDDGGITLYVGDNPAELTAAIEPAGLVLPIGWTFSDQESVSMEVSSDGVTCKITALKPSGRNDLTVVCNNLYTSIPVYLWNK